MPEQNFAEEKRLKLVKIGVVEAFFEGRRANPAQSATATINDGSQHVSTEPSTLFQIRGRVYQNSQIS